MSDYETDLSPETIPSVSDDDIETLAESVNVSIRLIERIEKLELALAKCKEENAKLARAVENAASGRPLELFR